MAALIAEELDVEWNHVVIVQAPVDPAIYDHLTVGSNSIREAWLPMRQIGAMLRAMLIQVAANRWNVPVKECSSEPGFVVGPLSRRVPYGELASDAARIPVPDPASMRLKRPEAFRLIGRSLPNADTRDKVNGAALFGIDVRLEGMLFAVVARAPVPNARPVKFDGQRALAVPGVRAVFEIPPVAGDAHTAGGIAVAATSTWSALEGRRRLAVDWQPASSPGWDSDAVSNELRRAIDRAEFVVRNEEMAKRTVAAGTRVLVAEYELPYMAHATMEPMNATVDCSKDPIRVWIPTQNPEDARAAVARLFGLPPDSVSVSMTYAGGGFGRRDATDFVVEAAQVSKYLRAPVQVVWSREDDIQFDRYRPAAIHQIAAALSPDGLPIAWTDRFSSTSIARFLGASTPAARAGTEITGAVDAPYSIPAVHVEYTSIEGPVRVGWWRSVADSINGFVVEGFMNELAHFAKFDALEYRLRLLDPNRAIAEQNWPQLRVARLRAVLMRVANTAGWGRALPEGHAQGIACHYCRGTYVAQVADVSLDGEGPKVHRVYAAVDCGRVINPSGVIAQIEGGIAWGLSAVLGGSISIADGRVVERNFDALNLLRMNTCPPVHIELVESSEDPSGVGETGLPPLAPAVAGAILKLTGRAVRRLPVSANI
jgi:isoquinoline 1-oxidoreductase beta subunit